MADNNKVISFYTIIIINAPRTFVSCRIFGLHDKLKKSNNALPREIVQPSCRFLYLYPKKRPLVEEEGQTLRIKAQTSLLIAARYD